MTIEDFARSFAIRRVCPMNQEPVTQYERMAVNKLTNELLAFWNESRAMTFEESQPF